MKCSSLSAARASPGKQRTLPGLERVLLSVSASMIYIDIEEGAWYFQLKETGFP